MAASVRGITRLGRGAFPDRAAVDLGIDISTGDFRAKASDLRKSGRVTHHRSDRRQTIVLGFPASLSPDRHLSPEPETDQSARVAGDLLDQFGADLPRQLAGDWIVIDWQPGRLRMVQSLARWDWLYFARIGENVLFSDDFEALAGLDAIGRDFDELGLAAALGRGKLRRAVVNRTFLRGVERLEPGQFIEFSAGQTVRRSAQAMAVPNWRGSFDDAVEQAQALLLAILRERIGDAPCISVALSGGLDSSTLATLLQEAGADNLRLFAVTSAAPEGSGLNDEFAHAQAVSRHLGIDQERVVPGDERSVYVPHEGAFKLAGGPTLSPRHYLYRELALTAQRHGAWQLFDGACGEFTLTGSRGSTRLLDRVRRFARSFGEPPQSPFHVRLAPHRARALEQAVDAALRDDGGRRLRKERDGLWGYVDGFDNTWASPVWIDNGMRREVPFRDPRLMQLFAGFPADFRSRSGLNRAPARAMMEGKLPESIRLRTSKTPFSPDYMRRIQIQAGDALARIAAYRAVEADDWLDLVWLEQELRRFDRQGARSVADAFLVQFTAMAAEFIAWWRR